MSGTQEIKIDYKLVNSSFNQGMKEISSEVTMLNKEFKLQKEQMKLTATESEKLEASLQKLTKEHQLAQQSSRLMESGYQNVVEMMGSGSREAEIWKSKLIDAQKNEQYLANAIKTTTDALTKANSSMSEASQKSEENKNKLKSLEEQQKQLANESKRLTSELKLEQSEMSSSATETEKLEKAKQGLKKQSELTEKQIENLEQQLKVAKAEYGENADEVVKLETALNDTKTSYNHLTNEMENSASASSQAGTGLSEVTDYLNMDLVMKFSEKIGQLSEKLIELGRKSFEAFREVDEGMDVITTKTGASGPKLKEMQDIARDIATTIPTDFATSGNAVGELNTQFGLTGDALRNASELMIKYADISGTDVTNSTIQAKQAISAYGLEVDDLGNVLDTTTYVAQQTGVSIEDLMTKAIDGAPQIKALGLSFDEGVSLMGRFEKAGVDSSDMLTYLSKATVNYAKDGLTLEEGLNGTIEKIKNATSETEAINIAAEVFGTKGAVRMVDAIKRGTFSMDDLSEASKNATNSVSKTYDKTRDPIDRFIMAQNKLKDALGQLGDKIAQNLAPVLEGLADVIAWLSDAFTNLPGPVQDIIVWIGLLIAGIGLILPIILPIIAAIQLGLIPILAGLIGAAMPIIGIIVGIVAVVALVIAIFKNWGAISAWLTGVWTAFKDKMSSIWESIKTTVISKVTGIKDGMVTGFNSAKSTAVKIWSDIANSITTKINNAKDAVKRAIDGIKGFLNFQWKWPKIPIPKVIKTGSHKIMGMDIPTLGIRWNALGGIFKRPTILGQYGGQLQGVGEAGAEAVLPLNREVLASIGVGVGATMSNDIINGLLIESNQKLDKLVNKNARFEMNGRVVAEEIRSDINELNEIFSNRQDRIVGNNKRFGV